MKYPWCRVGKFFHSNDGFLATGKETISVLWVGIEPTTFLNLSLTFNL